MQLQSQLNEWDYVRSMILEGNIVKSKRGYDIIFSMIDNGDIYKEEKGSMSICTVYERAYMCNYHRYYDSLEVE